MSNKMNHIEFVHNHSLDKKSLEDLMKHIYGYLVTEGELENTVKIVIKVILVKETDDAYAEVNIFTKDGANFEDYFML